MMVSAKGQGIYVKFSMIFNKKHFQLIIVHRKNPFHLINDIGGLKVTLYFIISNIGR